MKLIISKQLKSFDVHSRLFSVFRECHLYKYGYRFNPYQNLRLTLNNETQRYLAF